MPWTPEKKATRRGAKALAKGMLAVIGDVGAAKVMGVPSRIRFRGKTYHLAFHYPGNKAGTEAAKGMTQSGKYRGRNQTRLTILRHFKGDWWIYMHIINHPKGRKH